MSGRFFRHDISWDDYASALDLFRPEGLAPPEAAYNIAPTQIVPIVRFGIEDDIAPRGKLHLAPAIWGLVPSWWRKPLSEKTFATFKARSESVATAATYRGSFRHKRCLVPASGFNEWTGPEGRKTPFAIALRDRKWFCFAGRWDRAIINGSELDTFTILTTTPNDLMAGLQTRMPVILDPSDYDRWLDTSSRDVEDLYEPFASDAMHAWAVGSAVGNVRNQGVELTEEV